MSARLVLVLSASVASALTLGVSPVNKMVPVSPLHRASLAMAEPTVAEEEADKTLITLDAISDNYRMQVENALMLRNKERIMSGMPKYESIEAMVEAYIDFEGREKGMSQAECEDEVLRFLQRKSLMEEGSFDGWKDPQTVVTFGLLAALVVGISSNFVSQQLGGVAQ